MKHLLLAAATLLLIQGADARERRGPPPLCPQPKSECCPKETCKPKPVAVKPCKQDPCNPVCPPECFERGFPTNSSCTPAAYSQAAGIDLKCGWDTFISVSFIYWEAIQGGMDLATPGQATVSSSTISSGTSARSAIGYETLQTDFEYQPGFKVGLGWNGIKDDWALYAEYTWLHGSTNTSASASNPNVTTVNGAALPQTGIWLPTSFLNAGFTNTATTRITSNWNYKLDLLDAQMSRPYYSGARYSVEPFFGLRSAWIRQSLQMTSFNLATSGVATSGTSRSASYSSTSSAVGPRIGVNGNWMLGYGLKFIGNAAASLLYTGYDVRANVASPDASGATTFPVQVKLDDLHALRPNLDLSLGLGWGSYFKCRRFYWDLSATYDFSIFWEQNMMRYLADTISMGTQAAASDLYLQGLTIKTQFEF